MTGLPRGHEADPIPAALARLSSPDVTTGASPCPVELAEALADLLDAEASWEDEMTERVARAVLGWLS